METCLCDETFRRFESNVRKYRGELLEGFRVLNLKQEQLKDESLVYYFLNVPHSQQKLAFLGNEQGTTDQRRTDIRSQKH